MTATGSFGARLVRVYALEALAGVLRIGVLAVLARALGDEGFGIYSLALGVLFLVFQLGSLGLTASAGYFAAVESGRGVVDRSFRVTAAVAVAGVVVSVPFVAWYGQDALPELTAIDLALLLGASAWYSIENTGLSILRGRRRLTTSGAMAVVRQALLGLVAVLVLLGDGSARAALAGFEVVTIAVALLVVVVARRGSAPSAPQTPRAAMVRYGLQSYAATVITFIAYRFDLLMIGVLLDATSAGVYAVVLFVCEGLWFFSQIAAGAVAGQVTPADREAQHRIIERLARLVTLATVACAGVVAVVASPMLRVFGEEFVTGTTALRISLVGVVALALSRVLASFRAALGRPQANIAGSAAGLFVNVVGNLALIPAFGINGAATATTVSYLVVTAERVAYYRRLTGKGVCRKLLVPRRDDLRLVVQGLVRGTADQPR